MSLHYAPNVRNGAGGTHAPDGSWTREEWHIEASADTGVSHTLPGRLYVVQCEWCDDAFAAHTKREAMAMFRKHEARMLGTQDAEEAPYDEGHEDA